MSKRDAEQGVVEQPVNEHVWTLTNQFPRELLGTFLLNSETKQQLFKYISEEMRNATSDKIYHLLSTKGDIVISSKECDLSSISPCSQEEGDTRLQLQYTVIRILPIMDTLLLTFGPWLFLACHFFPKSFGYDLDQGSIIKTSQFIMYVKVLEHKDVKHCLSCTSSLALILRHFYVMLGRRPHPRFVSYILS